MLAKQVSGQIALTMATLHWQGGQAMGYHHESVEAEGRVEMARGVVKLRSGEIWKLMGALKNEPGIRGGVVWGVRGAIQDKSYESDEKIDAAIDALLSDYALVEVGLNLPGSARVASSTASSRKGDSSSSGISSGLGSERLEDGVESQKMVEAGWFG